MPQREQEHNDKMSKPEPQALQNIKQIAKTIFVIMHDLGNFFQLPLSNSTI